MLVLRSQSAVVCLECSRAGLSSPFSEVPAVSKLFLRTHEILNGAAQSFLCELVNPYMPPRSVHSQASRSLPVPKVKQAAVSDRALLPCTPAKMGQCSVRSRRSAEPAEDSHFVCFRCSVSFICPRCPVGFLLARAFLCAVTHVDGNICGYYREATFLSPQITTFFTFIFNLIIQISAFIHLFVDSHLFIIIKALNRLFLILIIATTAYLIRLQGHLQGQFKGSHLVKVYLGKLHDFARGVHTTKTWSTRLFTVELGSTFTD